MAMLDFINAAAGLVRNHYLELANQTSYYRAANRTSEKDRNIESTPPPVDTYEPSVEVLDQVAAATAVDDVEIIERDLPADEYSDDVVTEDVPEDASEEVSEPTYCFRHHTHNNYEVRLNFALQALAHTAQSAAEPDVSSEVGQTGGRRA